MINAFQEITSFEGENFNDHLAEITLFTIFEPVFTEYMDPAFCKKVVLYIVYANSVDSSKIGVGNDRRRELNKIFKDLDIPSKGPHPFDPDMGERNFYDEIVLMMNPAVVSSLERWLQHKDNQQLEYLFTLKNAYVQHQSAALRDIRKASSEIDYDQKFKCIEYMMKLKKMIADAESELQQNNPKLKQAYEEFRQAKQKAPTTGPADYTW
jgi:hypothetical protein